VKHRMASTGQTLVAGVLVVLGILLPSSSRPQDSASVSARAHHVALWLPDGRWLVAGGATSAGVTDGLHIFTPSGIAATGTMLMARFSATATVLPDGTALFAGGHDSRGPLDTLELFDPATGSITLLSLHLSFPVGGHSATLLANGQVLIAGGQGGRGQPQETVQLLDLVQGTVTTLVDLNVGRAGHTATLLTDGRVLITGGQTTAGVADTAEIWDPVSQTATLLLDRLWRARAGHTATLLQTGEVLLAGGDGTTGRALATLERFDPGAQTFQPLATRLRVLRAAHTATLLPTGELLLWGGVDEVGRLLTTGEVLDPRTGASRRVAQPLAALLVDRTPPGLSATIPRDGAVDVPTDAVLAVRFTEPMRVSSIAPDHVRLIGPNGESPVSVVPAESGLLAFITPSQPLRPGTRYTLQLQGLRDTAGLGLLTTRTFTTRGASGAPPAGVGPGSGSDSAAGGSPPLTSDRAARNEQDSETPEQPLPPLEAPPGVTAVAGRALQLDGTPLARVTLEIGTKRTRTDRTGRFLLEDIPSGRRVLLIDGRSANRGRHTYGVFEAGVQVTAGRTNVLPHTIWMPEIDTANAVTISSPTTAETVITSPRIPGLEVRIPAGTVIRDHEGRVVTTVSLTPIPLDRPPFPLPKNVVVPLYFTLQPGGGYLYNHDHAGARIIYPNRRQAPPGTRLDFWHYDPEDRGWFVYGQGAVSRDGRQIVPDPGVAVYAFTGAMVAVPALAPATGPVVAGARRLDPVDVATGLFVLEKTDLAIPDTLPLVLTRTYRQNDSRSRAFGIGAFHPYDIFMVGDVNPWTYVDVILPDGGRVHFVRISPGTQPADAVYQHTATPTAFYGAKIAWNQGAFLWELTFKDGTVWWFPEAALQTIAPKAALKQIRDRFGNTVQFTRDGQSGDLQKITSPNGRWIAFTYDSGHRITTAADNLGRTVQYQYDTDGRLTRVTDPAGGVTEYTYDAAHRMLTLKDARGIVFLTNAYDTSGRVITQTQADGTTYQVAYTVDANNVITQTDVTDPRGIVERLTFNGQGYVLTDTLALGRPEQQVTTYTRQAGTHLVQSVTDALSRQTTFTYDTMGNATSVVRLAGTPQAVTTTFTYEAPSAWTFNRLTSVTTPINTTTTWAYDDPNRKITITDPLGHQTVLTHNTAGQPVSVANALQQTTTLGYDTTRNLISVTDPLGNATTRAYDVGGRLRQQTDPRGNTTAFVYDPLNQLRAIGDPLKGATRFTYDPNGNLVTVTDARGNATSYAYNNMDRLQTRTDPLNRSESYTYDNKGNLATSTDRKSQVTSRVYDALDRVTQVTYADQSTTTYIWDAGNRLTQITDSISGTITRSYDVLDRLTQETTPQGSVSYMYDAAGRRTSMTVSGQPTVSYVYDNADRLTSITQGSSIVSFTYDNANRRTSLTLPNNVVTEYAYDTASRLTGLTYKHGSNTLGTLTYVTDANSQRHRIGGTWARTGLPQPVTSATYNAANHQLTFGGQTLTYDLNGNLTSDSTNTYTWNARNELAAISGSSSAGFGYDALGRRRQKTITGGTTTFLYDGLNAIQEATGSGVTNLLAALSLDEFLTRTDAEGSQILLSDGLGSTLALTDSGGEVATEYAYEPFGTTASTGAGSSNASQYTGRENDATGLYYYRARYYHPQLQRFIAEDPIGLSGGVNSYAYVSLNPLNSVDPLGLLENFTFDLNSQEYSVLKHHSGGMVAFSGLGPARNNPAFESRPGVGPIPRGSYYIVDRPKGGVLGPIRNFIFDRQEWFALYRDDGGVDDVTTIGGIQRGQFRLHLGSRSEGCITLTSMSDFRRLRELLLKTETSTIPGTNIKYYGTVTVR